MKKLIAIMFLALSLLSIGGQVLAADNYGLEATGTAAGLKARGDDLPKAIGTYLNAALSIVGIIFLILAIYGGFKILLSQGDAKAVKDGRNVIVYAIIGMIVIVLAYALTNFVFTNIIGTVTP